MTAAASLVAVRAVSWRHGKVTYARPHSGSAVWLFPRARMHRRGVVGLCGPCPAPRLPLVLQIVEQHKAFLRRLMKGCLLSRKVVVLRALLGLKDLALRFVRLSDDTASLKWDALEEEAEQKCMGTGERAGSKGKRAATTAGTKGTDTALSWRVGLGIERRLRA